MRVILRTLFLAACCAAFCTTPVKAKPVASFSKTVYDTTSQWILGAELNGVKAYYKFDKCGVVPSVLLKFVNTNDYTITASWDDQVTVTGVAGPVKVNEEVSTLDIPSGKLAAEICARPAFRQLVSRPNVKPEDVIESFVFLHLQVTAK